MNANSSSGPFRIVSPGHAVFAVTLIGLGIVGLVSGDFTPTWTGVPKEIPARQALAYLSALVSLLTGLGVLWQRTARVAAGMLLGCALAWLLLFRMSHLVSGAAIEATWWECGDGAVMAAAAWVLYAWFARDGERGILGLPTGERGLRIARLLYGLGLIPFGIAHFTYLQNTVIFIPKVLPGPTTWAYLTGAAFIAAGAAIVFDVLPRLAAALSAWMMGLFTLIVWVPRVLTGPSTSDWREFLNSCALTAAGWLVADSYRAMAWLASRSLHDSTTTASPMATRPGSTVVP